MKEKQLLVGSWIATSGQCMCAVANTPFLMKNREFAKHLNLWGNALQATGTAYVASLTEDSLEKLGIQIESLGYVLTTSHFLLSNLSENTNRLKESGELMQTLGVTIALFNEWKSDLKQNMFFDLFGYYLQVIDIKGVDPSSKTMISEWSQMIGSTLALIDQLKDFQESFPQDFDSRE